MFYEVPSKYKYDAGANGYRLLFTCILYVFAFSACYADVYASLGPRMEDDHLLYAAMMINALKPAAALFVGIWIVLSLFDTSAMFVLLFVCTLAFFGSFGLFVELMIDRFWSCNSPRRPRNSCNDPLYCCVWYAQVSSCAGLGPCPGSNVTSQSDLKPNPDSLELLIFCAIFMGLELLMIVFSSAVLNRLRRLNHAAALTNKALRAYHENGSDVYDGTDVDDDEDDEASEDESASAGEEGSKGKDEERTEEETSVKKGSVSSSIGNDVDRPFKTGPRTRTLRAERTHDEGRDFQTKHLLSKPATGSGRTGLLSVIGKSKNDFSKPGSRRKNIELRYETHAVSNSASVRYRTEDVEIDVNEKEEEEDVEDDIAGSNPSAARKKPCDPSCDGPFEKFKSFATRILGTISSYFSTFYYYAFYHSKTFAIYELHCKGREVYLSNRKEEKKYARKPVPPADA
jgi:hypothetical protein